MCTLKFLCLLIEFAVVFRRTFPVCNSKIAIVYLLDRKKCINNNRNVTVNIQCHVYNGDLLEYKDTYCCFFKIVASSIE